MGLLDILKIGAKALKAQKIRMEVIAANLANMHTTRTEENEPYRKREVVFKQDSIESGSRFENTLNEKLKSVKVEEIVESQKPFVMVYDPFHPDAGKDGYVTYPNVSLMEEMTDMMLATRSYEANVNLINVTKEMFLKTLEIGK